VLPLVMGVSLSSHIIAGFVPALHVFDFRRAGEAKP
jgi:hypothetical protein